MRNAGVEMRSDDPALQFLLNSADPSIRYLTLIDLLDKSNRSREVKAARAQILDGPRVKALLAGQRIGKQKSKEMFLRHRLFRATTTGQVIDPAWLKLHYPLYWHYDVLQALVILSRLPEAGSTLQDARVQEALDIVEAKR